MKAGAAAIVKPLPPANTYRVILTVFLAAVFVTLPGCSHRGRRVLEVAYVSAPQASLRDQVSAIYNRVGTVKNGERLEVIDH